MVEVAYKRGSCTRDSNCKALTGKIVVFRIGSHLWKVVAYERWSHMEVRLYFFPNMNFMMGTSRF